MHKSVVKPYLVKHHMILVSQQRRQWQYLLGNCYHGYPQTPAGMAGSQKVHQPELGTIGYLGYLYIKG